MWVQATCEPRLHSDPCSHPVDHKVYKDNKELLPTEPLPRSNDWIRSQSCVPECHAFRFQGKRPATIRHHLVSCRLRDYLATDPLARLCALQVAAGKQLKQEQRERDTVESVVYNSRRAESIRSELSGSTANGVEIDAALNAAEVLSGGLSVSLCARSFSLAGRNQLT